jgi:hypothetical protein
MPNIGHITAFCLALALAAGAAAQEDRRYLRPELPGAQTQQGESEDATGDEAIDPNWIDTSHAYATDQAQALTEWMDDFFGEPNYDLEQAESQLRIQWRNSWDEQDDYNTKVRLRGKLQLPKVSQRLNLVFSGEDGDTVVEDDREDGDSAELLFNVNEASRERVDLTLNINSDGLRPGVRYRNKGPIDDVHYYRFTQRLEWENDEGFYTTGQLNLDRIYGDTRLLRWSNRIVYGEETLGAEWRSVLSMSVRQPPEVNADQQVISYYAGVVGNTDPSFIENYRAGIVFRRNFYRKYLFFEVEPSYNLRKRLEDEDREGVWNIMLRFEVVLERDLRH